MRIVRKDEELEIMMNMQSTLQKRYYGKCLKELSPELKVKQTKEMILCMLDELMETMERTPWKHWKKYSKKDFNIKGEELKELQMEIIDVWHFFMNLCELWNLDAKTFFNMYVAKNKENFDRFKRGYSASSKIK